MNSYPYNYQTFYNTNFNPYVSNQNYYMPNQNNYNQNNCYSNNPNQNGYGPNNYTSSNQNNFNSYYNNNNNNNSNRLNNPNNGSSKKTIPKINLKEAILRSKYPRRNHDFIENFMIKTFGGKPDLTSYLSDKIFVIDYTINVLLNSKKFKVNILLYLPELFPDYEPELYLKNTGGNFGINIQNYEKSINKNNLKLDLDSFCSYDQINQNIGEVIEAIKSAFNQHFPIYASKNVQNNYVGRCCLNSTDLMEVDIPKKFTEEDVLILMRKKTKEMITDQYEKTIKNLNIVNDYNELNQMNNSLKANINIKDNNSNNNPITKELAILNEIKEQLKNVENNLQKEIWELKEKQNNANILEECENVVKFKDDEIVKLAEMQKAIEDYLSFVKKGFEKKKIPLEDSVKEIRELSRKLYHIDFLMKKRKEENY